MISCWLVTLRALKLLITLLASEPLLECAWMAVTRLAVRPSCRKKRRWPTPQSGADRKSWGPAAPWVATSASPVPMLWTAKSENGEKATLLIAGSSPDASVLSDGVWQFPQPMAMNSVLPVATSAAVIVVPPATKLPIAGLGGDENRIAEEKSVMSDDISEAVPVVVPLMG